MRSLGWAIVATISLGLCQGCDDGEGNSGGFEVEVVADRLTGNAPLVVDFQARSNGPLDAVYSYAWAFGDDSQSVQSEPEHIFARAGTYNVTVDVDAVPGGGGQGMVQVEVSPPADLDVGAVQVVPQRARSGEDVMASWGLRNGGAPVVGRYNLIVFIGPRQAYDAEAQELGVIERSDDPTLDVFAGFGETFTLPADLPAGDYFLGVVADPEGRIGDLNSGNNTAFAPFPITVRNPLENGPDLTICGLDIPAFRDLSAGQRPVVQQGDQLPINVCLGNIGDQPVGQASYTLYLSTDDRADPADVIVAQRADLPLGTGDTQDFADVLDVPLDLAAGTYFLIAVADPDDTVAERLEDNNERQFAGGFDIVEPGDVMGVDLVLAEITVNEERAFWGQALTGGVRLINRGDLAVMRPFVVRILAEPVNGGAEVLLGSQNVPGFDADGDEVFALDLTINRRVERGEYRLSAVADPTNSSNDVNTGNNRRTLQTVIELGGEPNVDPAIVDVSISADSVNAGDMLTLNGIIANLGGDTTGAMQAAIVFSPDATFERGDRVISTFDVESLEGGAESMVERTFVVPMDLDQQVGIWRVGLVIDPDNRINGEVDENNNVGFAGDPLEVIGATGGCAEDINEDNDVSFGAIRLGGGMYEGLGICDDADWFSVRVPAGRVFEVIAGYDEAEGRITLRQADRDGVTVRDGVGTAGTLRIFEPPQAEDITHYFEITGAGGQLQYDLQIRVDPSGEGPNLRARTVRPTPAIAEAGALVDVITEVVNTGGGRAEASVMRVELQRGDVIVVLAEDVPVPALESGTSAEVRARTTLPADIEDGLYPVRVILDSGETVAEGSEDDNVGEGALRVDAEQACQADPFEPNGSPIGGGVVQDAALIEEGEYPDLVACDGDDDWYAVELAADQRLAANIAFSSADGDLEMALYASDQVTRLDLSDGLQNTETVALPRAPMAGRYYVRVFMAAGDEANVANRYDLEIDIGDANECADDDYPNNGDRMTAALLPDGRHDLVLCPGDEDWFRFAIAAGNTVSFRLAAGDAGAEISLFNPDGDLIETQPQRIVHTAERNGEYAIRVTQPLPERNVYALTVAGVSGVDLEITDLRLSGARVAPGDDLRATFDVTNLRGDRARDILVRYTFSLDDQVSADDIVLAESAIVRIDGAQVLPISQRIAVPPDLQPDDGFLLVQLDPERDIADVRPSNNIVSAPLAVVAACEDDDARENEGPRTATDLTDAEAPLAGVVICAFTEDWYALPVEAGDVAISIAFDNDRGDLDLEVLAEDGLPLGRSASEADTERVEVEVDAAQILLIRVDGFLDAENGYTLDWTLPQ